MIRKIFLSAILAGACSYSMATFAVLPTPLNDYQAIKSALSIGKAVTLVTTFDRCEGQRDGKPRSLKMIGGLQIASFLIPDDKYIVFSDYHQRLSDKEGAPQVEFTRYKIMPDNHLLIETKRYPTTASFPGEQQEKVFSPVTWNCTIGSGAQFYSAP